MTYNTKGFMKKEDSFVAKEKVQEVNKYPFVACEERGIRADTLETFGVRAGKSQVDGKTVEAYYFPSYNQKGQIVGYMKQDLTKSKEEKGHWSAVGSVSLSNKLFGQDVVETVERKKNNLIVTEGQWDCLSVYQAMCDNVKGTKYAGIEPFVCSIPLGTGNAVEALLHNEELVKSFTGLTIFFDDDYCTPAEIKKGILKGHEAREAVANAFVGSHLSMFTIHPSKGYKDASDYVQGNDSDLLAKDVAFNKKTFSAEKIVKSSDITVDELIAPRPEGVYVDCFPDLMRKIHGFRTRELVLLTSPSGVGKCFSKGQGILMHDLSVKKVEDIVIGDKVMGDDGTPRTVLTLHSGLDDLYTVTPDIGLPYTVNSRHILYTESYHNVPEYMIDSNRSFLVSAATFVALPDWIRHGVLHGVFANFFDPQTYRRSTGRLNVEKTGYGEYFGFEVDGNHLFCLPDYQVTHNSTVTSFFANAFVERGERVGMIYLEETKVETLQRVVASKLKVNYLKFKNNPLSLATREQIEAAKAEIDANNQLVILDHFGSLPINQLMQKIKHMHFVEGCKYILLDHLSVVISGSAIDNERKELDIVMTELAAFCAANDVCIIAVSHINRDSIADQLKPKKGQENEPFWIRVGKESMRGSAALEQLSFIVLALEPEILPSRKRGKVRLVVLKNRPWGFLGQCDTFSVDDNTWEVLLSATEEDTGF